MFLYPALTIGFLFVAVPLLVHLINMLRHRRQRWAAMDFLLASYRKQKKWIRLRQLLLLLSRLAVAALLIAMLCGWTGGGQILGLVGGSTTHHVVILDDSYSMRDVSRDASLAGGVRDAYGRSLQTLQDLTRRLASDDGNHQLTVMRASRAAMTLRGGSDAGDAAADLSAQTIDSEGRLINRIMATAASPIRTDLVPALDLAAKLIETTPADQKFLYVASDFRSRDWSSPDRLAESMRRISSDDVEVRMIDCASAPEPNLAITDITPAQDVWVAGVPVVIHVKVKNYSARPVNNIALSSRVIRYSRQLQSADPTVQFSGEIESLPVMMIESIDAGAELTKSFQVFVAEPGTHAVEVSLPDDALAIDNIRSCTLPLSDVEKVLIIDADPDGRGQYHVASVLDPGSQVRIGAVPDIQPPSFLRAATVERLAPYRAIYLIDLPEIGENAADALAKYVRRGGGLAWFLGSRVGRESYNRTLLADQRRLLPAALLDSIALPVPEDQVTADVVFGQSSALTEPLERIGEAAISLIGVSRSWDLQTPPEFSDQRQGQAEPGQAEPGQDEDEQAPPVRVPLKRRDGKPLVTQHNVGQGRVITVLAGLDGSWTNWPGDPTFVVFLLQSNAYLWSGAAPSTYRVVDDVLLRRLPSDLYADNAIYVPATDQPPRVPIELETFRSEDNASQAIEVGFDPVERVISGADSVTELLRPGISEWVLTRNDGRGEVIPVASVIRVGEGDLSRADQAEIRQELMPLDVKFVSSSVWSEENQTAGSSTLTMLLLGLLGTVLAAEQLLAFWASYHIATNVVAPGGGER